MKVMKRLYGFLKILEKSVLKGFKWFRRNGKGNEESHEERGDVLLNKSDDQNVGDV